MNARRPWAWPLVPVYGAVLAAKDALRAAGLVRERRLGWPVISIGSLSAGGAGKTPVTIALANLLSDRGWTVDVLSRGYRREGRGVQAVDLRAGEPARQFGDEPTLIARRTGVPVWVGADRFAAGAAAEAHAPARRQALAEAVNLPQVTPQVTVGGSAPEAVALVVSSLTSQAEAEPALCPRAHLLDDGLQHRALARNFDLVVVTAEDLKDSLLPTGNLREPLSALRRADALAVREEDLGRLSAPLRNLVGREVPIWTVRRALRFPAPLGVFGAGLRPLAFCGLARPENFASMLARAGCGVVDTVIFPDHHRYTEHDIAELIRLAKSMDASGFLTTEKDAVKLTPPAMARLQDEIGPVVVAALDATFVYESPVVRALAGRLQALAPSRAVDETNEVRSR